MAAPPASSCCSTARSPAATLYFYYTGSYTADRGKWRGELITNEHTKSAGARPLFGGREVTCGFTGSYSADAADVNGTALVGKTSVVFYARLALRSEL